MVSKVLRTTDRHRRGTPRWTSKTENPRWSLFEASRDQGDKGPPVDHAGQRAGRHRNTGRVKNANHIDRLQFPRETFDKAAHLVLEQAHRVIGNGARQIGGDGVRFGLFRFTEGSALWMFEVRNGRGSVLHPWLTIRSVIIRRSLCCPAG